jgi:hypothetical protein
MERGTSMSGATVLERRVAARYPERSDETPYAPRRRAVHIRRDSAILSRRPDASAQVCERERR